MWKTRWCNKLMLPSLSHSSSLKIKSKGYGEYSKYTFQLHELQNIGRVCMFHIFSQLNHSDLKGRHIFDRWENLTSSSALHRDSTLTLLHSPPLADIPSWYVWKVDLPDTVWKVELVITMYETKFFQCIQKS